MLIVIVQKKISGLLYVLEKNKNVGNGGNFKTLCLKCWLVLQIYKVK